MTILVCGDAMRDVYWWGDVARISPEAPVPVVQVLREEERKGAADNVIANIEAMGGAALRACCETSRKIRLVARQQQVARIDFDAPPTGIEAMEAEFSRLLPGANIVVFSDYAKGSLVNIRRLIAQAKAAGILTLVDPKGHDYERYRGADLLKPNIHEIREMVGGWSSEFQLEDKVVRLMTDCDIGKILLTRGSSGMTFFYGREVFQFAAETREVYDVTGAGDTAIAALAVAIDMGKLWPEAVRIANRAAGIVCGKFGTSCATKEEVFGSA